jgi:hypothetical protein
VQRSTKHDSRRHTRSDAQSSCKARVMVRRWWTTGESSRSSLTHRLSHCARLCSPVTATKRVQSLKHDHAKRTRISASSTTQLPTFPTVRRLRDDSSPAHQSVAGSRGLALRRPRARRSVVYSISTFRLVSRSPFLPDTIRAYTTHIDALDTTKLRCTIAKRSWRLALFRAASPVYTTQSSPTRPQSAVPTGRRRPSWLTTPVPPLHFPCVIPRPSRPRLHSHSLPNAFLFL